VMGDNNNDVDDQEEEFLNENTRNPKLSDLKPRRTEDSPINYLNVKLGRESISGIIELLKKEWNPLIKKCFTKCLTLLGLPIRIWFLILKISVIYQYFQEKNFTRDVVSGFNETSIQNRSVNGFSSKECYPIMVEEDYASYSCWKVHYWYGILAIIFLYSPSNNII